MSICASLDSAATGTGRAGLPRCGFHGKMMDYALSCHIKEAASTYWRPVKMARVDTDKSNKTMISVISIQSVTVVSIDLVEISVSVFFCCTIPRQPPSAVCSDYTPVNSIDFSQK